MSKAEITETGYKWYRIKVSFSQKETPRAPADLLRYAGGQLRYGADGALTVFFSLRASDPKSSHALVKLLACFGEKGYFDEGQSLGGFFIRNSENDDQCAQAWATNSRLLNAWLEDVNSLISQCLQNKISRVATVRQVQKQFGGMLSETVIRNLAERILQVRYGSAIFGATILRRLGWQDLGGTAQVAATTEKLRKIC